MTPYGFTKTAPKLWIDTRLRGPRHLYGIPYLWSSIKLVYHIGLKCRSIFLWSDPGGEFACRCLTLHCDMIYDCMEMSAHVG